MSAGLIKHLKRKTEEDSNTRILMSQWEFDEKLVGKSLENVGSYYPHFSSHNESHSQQILVNIERLLGNNIEKLTATDTWLILETAYWHDIGMLFNADEVQDVVKNEKFKDYVEELANNNVQDLHEFAKVWHNDGWEAALVHYDNPYKGVEKYRQMVAEWYRRDHPANSERVVLKPFEKLNISSPRTELLPNRIYRYLAQICLSHGKSFNYVMQDLPFRQTGMGTEDCHPRFVACLLRLGDLFDIDDNRFCPVMARQVGNMPSFSETHKHKHQAIREFQLDNETVSVTAVCSTEMAYIECRNWFDWIKEEIQNQMSQWKNIVPSRDFGLLPTINKLDVEMTDKKILLNDKPMKFSLDERSAIELLQGNNLYKDDMSIYRELIQNAIDATMIRVWLEHGSESSQEPLSPNANPYDEGTRKIFEKYSIEVDCKKVADNDDSTLWEFSIKDHGIGISRKDLEYMQKIAGSKNNKEKQKIIRQMPAWMRPSGEFGIGLHSAFLLMKDLPVEKQKILLFTKSRLTHESLKIELNSPLSGKSGYCFIEEIDNRDNYGTKLIVSFESKLPKDITNDNLLKNKGSIFNKRNNISNANSFKYFYQKNIFRGSYQSFITLSKIKSIINTSCLPVIDIRLSRNLENIDSTIEKRSSADDVYYWDADNSSKISVEVLDASERYDSWHSSNIFFYYKGSFVCRLVSNHGINIKNNIHLCGNFIFSIDIYGSTAKEILNLNRSGANKEYEVAKIFEKTFANMINNPNKINISQDISKEHKKSKYSMLFKLLELEINPNNLEDSWRNYLISSKLKFSDLLKLEKFSTKPLSLKCIQKIPNLEVIESITFEDLLHIDSFRNIIEENKFKCFIYNTNNFSKEYGSEVIYSKNNLSTNDFTKIPLEGSSSIYFRSLKDILESLNKSLKNYFLQNHRYHRGYTVNSAFLGNEPEIYNANRLSSCFFPRNKEEFQDLFLNKEDDKYYIFPFILFRDLLILTPIEQLYNNFHNDISINRIKTLNDEICKHIIDTIQTDYLELYEAYIRGKNFQSIDLAPLDKVFEPTT